MRCHRGGQEIDGPCEHVSPSGTEPSASLLPVALPVGRGHHQIGQLLQPCDGAVDTAEGNCSFPRYPISVHLASAGTAVCAGEQDRLRRPGLGVRQAAVGA